jgi:nucleoside-diphosphate-sugar epimerase
MSVLVIGGSGFLGKKIMKRLSELGEEPICFDLYPPDDDQLMKCVEFCKGDVACIDDIIACIIQYRTTKIINLAYIMPVECEERPQLALRFNVLGTNNVFEAARLCVSCFDI